MKTLREKITFALTALAYVLFHLRLDSDLAAAASSTAYQMLLTAPYAAGFTYFIQMLFRKLTGTSQLPWDRLLRIFFTIAILFAFFLALYEYAGGKAPVPGAEGRRPSALLSLADHALPGIQPAPGGGVGQQQGLRPDERSRTDYGITAGLHLIAQDSAEFTQASVNRLSLDADLDIARKKPQVGALGPGTQVDVIAQDGIAQVSEMPCFGVVEQDGMLHLGCMPDHAAFTD